VNRSQNKRAAICVGERGIRPAEACSILGIGKSTLFRWVAEGKLPAPKKASSRVSLFKLSDLERFLEPASDGAA
jgi:excisionase family DNA binding protein